MSMKEGNLINMESSQHLSQRPPVLIAVLRYHIRQHGAQRADGLVQVAHMDCVNILHEHILHGQEVPPVIRHVTGLHLGENVGDKSLEVSIIMSSSAGFLGKTRIFQNMMCCACVLFKIQVE